MGFALVLGGPGLFLIAFLDSSFLSFPEVVDLLMMGLVTRHKERMLFYALLPTLGSLGGCLVLYFLARKGGEAFLRKRFHERHVDRALAVFQKYGLLAVAVPVHPAAADAIQAVRACGGRRRRPAVRLHRRGPDWARHSLFR